MQKGKKKLRHSLNPMKPVLREWTKVLLDYSSRLVDTKDADHPWWYRERTQIGFLAAAAWRIGGLALEEWRMKKLARRRSSTGRGDLWLWYRNNSWFIEAKHDWCEIQRKKESYLKSLLKGMNSAENSARAIPRKHVNRIAVLFISVLWKQTGRSKSSFEYAHKNWKSACKDFKKSRGIHHVEFAYPEMVPYRNSTSNKPDECWLGMVMFLKDIDAKRTVKFHDHPRQDR